MGRVYWCAPWRALATLLLGTLMAGTELVAAAEAPPPQVQWTRNMGQSGLRRFYSTGADLGELVNRQVTYQVANRLESLRRAAGRVPEATELASETEGYVGQYDSLLALDRGAAKPLFLRALARSAKRLEHDRVHSTNDRFDLGVLYAPSSNSYLGVGLVREATRATLKYVTGDTDVEAFGPRIDYGQRFSPTFAIGLRAEQLRFEGDNRVTTSQTVTRPLDYRRRYLQAEALWRFTSQQLAVLPAGLQVGGSLGLYGLDTRYEPQTNSLGQTVREPFGNRERLTVLRGGVFLSQTLGAGGNWNPYAELLLDREIRNNLSRPLDDRSGYITRLGLARLLGPGKRMSVEWQHTASQNQLRERDNFLFVTVLDF